jgi:lantibiotic modifying enzyme
MVTIEDFFSMYPLLHRVLVEEIVSSLKSPDEIIEKLEEMRLEAKFQQQHF